MQTAASPLTASSYDNGTFTTLNVQGATGNTIPAAINDRGEVAVSR
jgi:hypothetical protein